MLSNVLSALRVIAKEENEINGCAFRTTDMER